MRKTLSFNGMSVLGLVKSIQRGTLSFTAVSATATINAVKIANSILNISLRDVSALLPNRVCMRGELTNSTTITGYRNTANTGAGGAIAWEVYELIDGIIRSIQSGTYTFTASTSTATVNAVDINKSFLFNLSFTTTEAGGSKELGWMVGTQVLTNLTTITFTSLTALTRTVGYLLVELEG